MQSRFRLSKKCVGLVVEHPHRSELEHIRRTDPRFKRARIRDVIQMMPSKCAVGVVYQWGERV